MILWLLLPNLAIAPTFTDEKHHREALVQLFDDQRQLWKDVDLVMFATVLSRLPNLASIDLVICYEQGLKTFHSSWSLRDHVSMCADVLLDHRRQFEISRYLLASLVYGL